jgi:2-polyprenyl-6-methoxyphenol hydroxylase-like FAD-dependent oxidoreductase
MSLPRNRFDVVVIGGGPAGTAVALALVTQGVSVLVVERSNYQQLRFGETLPPEIQPTLSRLGLARFPAGASPSLGRDTQY